MQKEKAPSLGLELKIILTLCISSLWTTSLFFVMDQAGMLKKISRFLALFSKSTGMRINEQKYTLTPINIEGSYIQRYTDILSFNISSFDDGLKYMGFRLKQNNYKKEDWNCLLENLEKKYLESSLAL